MNQSGMWRRMDALEALASGSKMGRLWARPGRYIWAWLYRKVLYPRRGEQRVQVKTFFDEEMEIALPSSTDIYLTGGKSHNSEIRLARFFVHQLKEGGTVLDVGAHYGYFSLLAAHCDGERGRVVAFEAAPRTFQTLQKNLAPRPNCKALHRAVSDREETLEFYEFPNLYSEYNAMDIEQYEGESWYAAHPPQAVKVNSVLLDAFLEGEGFRPELIKIDVEGAEERVLLGAKEFLNNNSPHVVMEYVCDQRGNAAHQRAEEWLREWGFAPHILSKKGRPEACADVRGYLRETGLESDNIVFIRNSSS
jgi:FkbM family methyltransferase